MAPVPILDHPLTDPSAWDNESLGETGGQFFLPEEALAEIRQLAILLEDNPLAPTCLDPADFGLPHCRAAMVAARRELDKGRGFVLIDRLPLDQMSREVAIGVYWILMSMVGRCVAQKWDGKMIYGVADTTGKPPGDGIRADVTNAEQNFHTDNSYNLCPPDHVVLLCLHPAREGGISRVTSVNTAHNRMREAHPKLLQRLYQPFFYDRQREHAPDDVQVIERPVLSVENGRLKTRLSAQLIRQGYELVGKSLDAEGEDALAAFYEILDDPALYREFFFEPGQIQIVDNRCLAHKRTKFTDWPEPERKRQLIRLWLREEGRAFYNG
ncbi:MAG: TauD/TfdA family dioxygenase [Proteobacteria bacterium]|nr:TauD/TfdA family dioxygenase [Pseudomonadota bacterium]